MIPPAHALRACLALKLWSMERKSHVMSLVADEGLALFSGLNVTPQEELLQRILLPHHPAPDPKALGRLARSRPGAQALGRLFLQPGFPFGALLWAGSPGGVSLRVHAQPQPAQHPGVSWPRMSRARAFAIPTPICARARKPTKSSPSSLSGKRLTGSGPGIWSLIPS